MALTILILLATTWVLPTSRRESVVLGALAVQYCVVAALAASALPLPLAVAKAIVGLFTVLMLAIVGRFGPSRPLPPTGEICYLALAQLLAFAIALGLSRTYALPAGSRELSFGVYWLALAGLLTLAVVQHGRRLAYALLMFESAVFLLVAGYLEAPTPVVFASLLVGNLLLGLNAAYLVALERVAE